MPRRQTATPAERGLRQLLRFEGFRTEAVSWVRAQVPGEHTAVVCWTQGMCDEFWEMYFRSPLERVVDVTRVRYPRVGVHQVRIFLRWAQMEGEIKSGMEGEIDG